MSHFLASFALPFDFSWLEQVGVLNGAIDRLLLACLLGGLVVRRRIMNFVFLFPIREDTAVEIRHDLG